MDLCGRFLHMIRLLVGLKSDRENRAGYFLPRKYRVDLLGSFGRYISTFGLCMSICSSLHSQSNESAQHAHQKLPGELQKILADAKWTRKQAMKGKFDPILRDLSGSSASNPQALYLAAIYGVFFSDQLKPERAFGEWRKQNKEILEDPRLQQAMQLAILNMRGQIYFVLEEEEQSTECFNTLLNRIAVSPSNIGGFHLMQESLQSALLVKYYRITTDYWKEAKCYTGTINDVESLFLTCVLPYYESKQPKSVGVEWDQMIAAAQRIKSINAQTLEQFNLTELPRLLTAKADSAARTGDLNMAITTLKNILLKFPTYPRYSEVEKRLEEIAKSASEDRGASEKH